jgi:hypothetical protein
VLRVPLDGVAEDHVVGVEIGAVVELDAGPQGAGPDGRILVGAAVGRQGRDGGGVADLVPVERLIGLLTARSVSPSVSSAQYMLSGSAFCMNTSVSRSPAFMAASCSAPNTEAYAFSTSAL